MNNENQTSRFQIFTDQTGVPLFKLNKEEIHIDGEYDIEELVIDEVERVENFKIEKIDIVWDINQLYIIGFFMYSSKVNYYFIRLSDEISMVNKDVFEHSISKLKHVVITEK